MKLVQAAILLLIMHPEVLIIVLFFLKNQLLRLAEKVLKFRRL